MSSSRSDLPSSVFHLHPSVLMPSPNRKLAWLSPFNDPGLRHGGGFRTRQIRAIIESSGFCLHDSFNPMRSSLRRKGSALLHVLRARPALARNLTKLKQIVREKLHATNIIRQAVHGAPLGIIIEHSYSLNPFLLPAALNTPLPVIVLPHNLEALVPEQPDRLTGRVALKALETEVSLLRRAASVFTISQEEAWLLRNLQCQAACLPYFPAAKDFDALASVRRDRLHSRKRTVLILGTAHNAPTRIGMERLANILSGFRLKPDCRFALVGLRTERLRDVFARLDVQVYGYVEDCTMSSLLRDCRAAVIHQETGTGALTRIPNCLVAGIPVIASQHAARSFHGVEGVYTYQGKVDLCELLRQELPSPPLPPRPDAEIRFFQEELSEIFTG